VSNEKEIRRREIDVELEYHDDVALFGFDAV
jgi:hypothetical protein